MLPSPEPKDEARIINKYFRVLLAEHNAADRKAALEKLGKIGYEADVAANGLEVLEALKSGPYDLVLMDCQMPEMDGFQATAEIRKLEENQRRTPIIAMTANAMEGDRERCAAAGMDDYISKPVRTEKLAEAMGKWDASLAPCTIAYLREMAGPENPEFLAELAETYLADIPSRMEAIRAAIRSGKAKELQEAAHALKGSSGNMGVQRVEKLCRLLEGVGKAGAVEGAGELMADLEKEIPAAAAAMEALRRGKP
ncbi:MAG: response regulator [Elusimicrobiales bacterium]|nr:response regulator [Elusimicrobiales bacterium]